jgi:hypothetical protein
MKIEASKLRLNIYFAVFAFAFILFSTGSLDLRIILYGNSDFTNLSNFNQIFSDLGGPMKSGDGGWHLRVASELASQNFVSNGSIGWLTSAPPGVGVAEALMIKFFGFKGFGISYCIFISLLWAFSFLSILGEIHSKIGLIKHAVILILIMQYTGFSQWMTGPGIFFTEALSTPLLIVAAGMSIRALSSSNSSKRGLFLGLSAVFLASASFVRANFVYTTYLFILVGALIFVTRKVSRSKKLHSKLSRFQSNELLMIGVGSLIALAPYYYMAKNYLKMPLGALNSTGFHLQYAWINPDKDQFKTIGAGWLCDINEKYCQNGFEASASVEKYARQLIETFMAFPIEVIQSRFSVFLRGWFSGEGPGATGSFDGILQGIVLLLFLVGLIVYHFCARTELNRLEVNIFLIFLVSSIAPYLITHVEVRFFVPAKILILCFAGRLFLSNSLDKVLLQKVNRKLKSLFTK